MNGFDLGTVIAALEIMGKGMLGIFVTILIIMLCVMVMGKIGGKDSSQKAGVQNPIAEGDFKWILHVTVQQG